MPGETVALGKNEQKQFQKQFASKMPSQSFRANSPERRCPGWAQSAKVCIYGHLERRQGWAEGSGEGEGGGAASPSLWGCTFRSATEPRTNRWWSRSGAAGRCSMGGDPLVCPLPAGPFVGDNGLLSFPGIQQICVVLIWVIKTVVVVVPLESMLPSPNVGLWGWADWSPKRF